MRSVSYCVGAIILKDSKLARVSTLSSPVITAFAIVGYDNLSFWSIISRFFDFSGVKSVTFCTIGAAALIPGFVGEVEGAGVFFFSKFLSKYSLSKSPYTYVSSISYHIVLSIWLGDITDHMTFFKGT